MTSKPARPVVFLDRDGTINVDTGYVHEVEQWRFAAGAIGALARLQESGFALAIVTNQSGIGRGRYGAEDVIRVHSHMNELLRDEGITIDGIAWCPHRPDDGCSCRKPGLQMLETLAEQLGFPLPTPGSWMVGDRPTDIGFGQAAGVPSLLIRSDYWSDDDLDQLPAPPTAVVSDLAEAADLILEAGASCQPDPSR